MARILVADDAAIVRQLVARVLKEAGHEVVGEAASGSDAIEQFGRLHPDLALVDVNMPDGGGIDAVREIRRSDRGTPIVVCSVLTTDALARRARDAGATAFLQKPFAREALLACVGRHAPAAA